MLERANMMFVTGDDEVAALKLVRRHLAESLPTYGVMLDTQAKNRETNFNDLVKSLAEVCKVRKAVTSSLRLQLTRLDIGMYKYLLKTLLVAKTNRSPHNIFVQMEEIEGIMRAENCLVLRSRGAKIGPRT
ncbi:MAG: hypothetical protein OXQ84_14855 [bacterium]|nr:hypothetical protein [bacterium]